jgi:hypothetical protein
MQAHLMEHMAFKYRVDIEKQMGVSMPPDDEELPIDIENQISRLAAEAAPIVLQMHSKKAAQEAAVEQQKDPSIQAAQQQLQIQQKELEIKSKDIERKSLKDKMDAAAKADDIRLREEKMHGDQELAGTKLGIEIKRDKEKNEADQEAEGVRLGIDIAKHKSQVFNKNNGTNNQ